MGLLNNRRLQGKQKLANKGKRVQHKSKTAQIKDVEKPNRKVKLTRNSSNLKKMKHNVARDTLQKKSERKAKSLEGKKDHDGKRKKKEEEEDDGLEEYEVDEMESKGAFYFPTEQLQISEEDDAILKRFNLELDDQKKKRRKNSFMGEIIFDKIEEKFEEKKDQAIQESILNDPNVMNVYTDVAKLMKEYRSGKLPKAFKFIHMMDQWDKVLELTKPEEWTPHAMRVATKVFASNLDMYRAQQFFESYLLPALRKDIKTNHNLHVQHYMAVKDAFYKPAAWFKGIVFPLCKSGNCGIKEATIIASVLKKLSVPILHSAAALMILADMDYCGAVCIFIKTLLEKKYALHLRAINALLSHFRRFEDTPGKMPVIWQQNLLTFVKLYAQELDDMQREGIKQLVKKKNHHLISPEIIKALDFRTKEDVIKNNLNKSFMNSFGMNVETNNSGSVLGGMNVE